MRAGPLNVRTSSPGFRSAARIQLDPALRNGCSFRSIGGGARRRCRQGAVSELPPDRRLRLPVGLRGQLPGGAGRLRRVALPAAARLPEHLRSPPRPHRRDLPVRADGHPGPPPPPLRPRHLGSGDDLAHADRVAFGAGLPRCQARQRRDPAPRLPARPGRRGRHRHAAARGHVYRGPGRDGAQRGARLRIRPEARLLGVRR